MTTNEPEWSRDHGSIPWRLFKMFHEEHVRRVRIEISDRALAAWVFAAHGLLDGFVTAAVFARTESTGIESNPYLTDLLLWAMFNAKDHSLWLWLSPFFVVKIGSVGLAVGLLWIGRPYIPRWRIFAGSVAALGLLVVANNLAAIA